MINSLFQHSSYLNKALDATWMRNEVINNNIANVDTPGFKTSKVRFEDVLKDAVEHKNVSLKTTNDKHIQSKNTLSTIEPFVEKDIISAMRMDGNNVDIEAEQADLAKNAIEYYTLVSKLNSYYSRLRYAINEGK